MPQLPSDVMEIADIWKRNIRGLNIFWKKLGMQESSNYDTKI